MDEGVIYELTSPSGKSYIGQVVNFISRGDPKGLSGRWKQHVNSSNSSNPEKGCRYLNSAIKKYGANNFRRRVLVRTKTWCLDFYEELCIKIYGTLAPGGYNLQKGGKTMDHTPETCRRRSESMKKMLKDPEKKKIWSKAKLGVRQKKRRARRKKEDNDLPKYIVHYKSGKYEGYEVNCHPKCKSKKFTKSKFTMEERLEMAKDHLRSLGEDI